MSAQSRAPSASESVDERYQIERKLGQGATGAVYLVRDRETGEQLALKKLFRVDAKTVLRLKREFRSLQAVNHPHIIKLYDMGQLDNSWFLTMEYVDGSDLTTYLAGSAAAAGSANDNAQRGHGEMAGAAALIAAFRQLAQGIQALHDAGMLHRDLKPSNVLVVDDRVVVLDFGLTRELSVSAVSLTEDESAAGTPAYMAPEQVAGKELTAASDWYAFGVMLYEALTGLLPIDGSMLELMRGKLDSDPVPVEHIVPEVPNWLAELCMALLQRDGTRRPLGAAVLARFEAAQPTAAALPATSTEALLRTETDIQRVADQLFGREQESKRLWRALAQAEDGRAVVVHVRGPSGTGKSALVEHFLDRVERRGAAAGNPDVLVLRSRCYELEAMPFKALDGVMDVLARQLSLLDDFSLGHVLPIDTPALARVFPVLERLNAVKRLISTCKQTYDALQSRRRAELGLRALLENLAARAPLVVWIDDLHWGDLDSARILRDWVLQPSAAAILFIFAYRSDELATSSCLAKLLGEPAALPDHTIEVTPLGAADIQALCEPHLRASIAAREELIARVVREAQGSPFLASQLIALAQAKSARGDDDLHTLSLDLMIAHTSAMLADDAKKLLALLAVAGRPMPPKLALKAAGVKRGGRGLVHDLRGLYLVRTREVSGERMLEVYHDRVRERVRNSLSADESRQIHAALFNTLERSGHTEPDWLHSLALGAADSARALHYGLAAAERANLTLAFERAAGLYRTCIEIAPAADSGELWSKLSLALARCGRGLEAAEASLAAAEHVPAAERVAWLQRAASHFLRSGYFAQGEALLRKVLEAKHIHVPDKQAGLMAAIAWERVWIAFCGAKDRVRPAREISAELLARFDLLASLSLNTHQHDPLRAALFQDRALRCALEAGEPRRLIQALSSAGYAAAVYGSAKAARDSEALLTRAQAVNAQLAAPDAKPIWAARAVRAFMLGRMAEVLEAASEVDRLFKVDAQDDPSGNYYRRFMVASVRLGALHGFGRYKEFSADLYSLRDEAVATDNRAVLLQLSYVQTLAEQIAGRGESSRARLDAQRAELPEQCFGNLHVLHMVAVMCDARWTGEYDAVREYLDAAFGKFLRSTVRRAAFLRLRAHAEHASFVLNHHFTQGSKLDPSQLVRKDMRTLEKLTQPAALGAAQRCRARLALFAGRREEAIACLRVAAAQHAPSPHEEARDQYALGALLSGEAGRVLRATARERIRELGVVDVLADLRANYPEFMELGEA